MKTEQQIKERMAQLEARIKDYNTKWQDTFLDEIDRELFGTGMVTLKEEIQILNWVLEKEEPQDINVHETIPTVNGCELSDSFAVDAQSTQPTDQKSLTFGEKLVELTFNPSNDDAVGSVKQLFADITDILHNVFHSEGRSGLAVTLYEHTLGEILNAQMNVVKVLTLKY